MEATHHLRAVRAWLGVFIAGLVLSGVTAFPLVWETGWLVSVLNTHALLSTGIIVWVTRVHEALVSTGIQYPFLAYGTDWLAFAHIVLAIAFLGPMVDPVRNKWVLQFGVIACAAVPALALIAGPIRGIPFAWRLIDSSFGVFGAIPLLCCLWHVQRMNEMS